MDHRGLRVGMPCAFEQRGAAPALGFGKRERDEVGLVEAASPAPGPVHRDGCDEHLGRVDGFGHALRELRPDPRAPRPLPAELHRADPAIERVGVRRQARDALPRLTFAQAKRAAVGGDCAGACRDAAARAVVVGFIGLPVGLRAKRERNVARPGRFEPVGCAAFGRAGDAAESANRVAQGRGHANRYTPPRE